MEEVTGSVLLLPAHDDRGQGGEDQDQQVSVLTLRAEHGRLRAHLAPVPACAGQAGVDQGDAALIAPGLDSHENDNDLINSLRTASKHYCFSLI